MCVYYSCSSIKKCRWIQLNVSVLWQQMGSSLLILFLSSIPLLLSVWTIDLAFVRVLLILLLLFIYFFVYLSYVLHVFICARGLSENWRYCSVTSSDSVTPRRFSTTPTTRCCLGCGPTAPPTCRGTGMHPTAFILDYTQTATLQATTLTHMQEVFQEKMTVCRLFCACVY